VDSTCENDCASDVPLSFVSLTLGDMSRYLCACVCVRDLCVCEWCMCVCARPVCVSGVCRLGAAVKRDWVCTSMSVTLSLSLDVVEDMNRSTGVVARVSFVSLTIRYFSLTHVLV